jgi:hypothetical protein
MFPADSYRWLGERSPAADTISALLREFKEVLGDRAYLYCAALAVFPALHPKLTLALESLTRMKRSCRNMSG